MACFNINLPPTVGAVFSGPFRAIELHKEYTICTILGTGKQVTILKCLSYDDKFIGHDLQVDVADPTVLHVTDRSLFVDLSGPLPTQPTLIELCAGIGGIGIGATLGGFRVKCQVDLNDLAVAHLGQLGMGDVLQLDVTADSCYRRIHELGHKHVTTLAAGFNCQPFSFLGDLKGLQDYRARSLLGTLRGAYLLQPESLVLECTPGAGLDFQVREVLRAFLVLMDWTSQDLTFDLSAQWPCCRNRWWIICYPRSCKEIPFVAWPRQSKFSSVGQVIPEWPIWSPEELEMLCLTKAEHEAYFETHPDMHRILDTTKPVPTFLHSYGNATTGCPCKCRSTAFRPDRLARDGLRGFMIYDAEGHCRFLHPREVAFLLTFPAGVPVMSNLRATLCMLGQSAAPLQSLWVFLHLKSILFGPLDRDFLDIIQDFQTQLLFAKYHMWPTPSVLGEHETTVDNADGVPLIFRFRGPCSLSAFFSAERINTSWGQQTILLDGGVRVPSSTLLRSQGYYGPYTLVRTMKHQPRDICDGMLLISLKGGDFDFFEMCFLPVGSFIFEALTAVGLPTSVKLTTEEGQLLHADARLWNSQILVVFQLVGLGLSTLDLGLHMDFVHLATTQLHTFVNQSECFRIFGLVWTSTGWKQCFGSSLLDPPQEKVMYLFCCLYRQHWSLCRVFIPDARCVEGHFHLDFADGFCHSSLPPPIHSLQSMFEDLWFLDCAL